MDSLFGDGLVDVLCRGGDSLEEELDAQTEKNSNPNVLIVKDHMLQTIKGVQLTKSRCSVNMWWTTKKVMPPF